MLAGGRPEGQLEAGGGVGGCLQWEREKHMGCRAKERQGKKTMQKCVEEKIKDDGNLS